MKFTWSTRGRVWGMVTESVTNGRSSLVFLVNSKTCQIQQSQLFILAWHTCLSNRNNVRMRIYLYKCCIFKGQLSAPQQQKTHVQTRRMSHSCQSQPAKQKRVERAMNISQESNYSSGFCLDWFYLSYAGYTCMQRCLLLLLTQNRLQWHPQVFSRVMVLWYHVCSSFNGCNKSIRFNWWHAHLIYTSIQQTRPHR